MSVIGIGPEGLPGLGPEARARLARADRVWGAERLLRDLPATAAVRVPLPAHGLRDALRTLTARGDERIVVLASGDPLFYGVGATVLELLPADEVELLPAVTSLQAAFALARMPWDGAALASVHARPLADLVGLARRHRRLGILTDPASPPGRIAAALLAAGAVDGRAVVVEDIGGPGQRVVDTVLSALPGQSAAPLNVLLLDQGPAWRPAAAASSRPDDAYAHRAALITKRDVRRLVLDRLAITEGDAAWDVGAGSGSVSIEMAELAWRGRVFAVEREAERLNDIRVNLERFGIPNVELVDGAAPEALAGLPAPDAVFIGGTGGRIEPVLEAVGARASAGCRVVATFAVLEHVVRAHAWLRSAGWEPELVQIQLAAGAPIGDGTRLVPANPVFIVAGVVPGPGGHA
ncbi:MAG: precorrin-6y C5,15-methyltransferase (decarboxylating) subunit CbiE [Candidatus Limnocylindrales bacterium]